MDVNARKAKHFEETAALVSEMIQILYTLFYLMRDVRLHQNSKPGLITRIFFISDIF